MKYKQKKMFNKLSLPNYLKPYKPQIFLYLLMAIISSVCSVLYTIMLGNTMSELTLQDYKGAITLLLVTIGIHTLQRLCWCCSEMIYIKYSNKIMSDLNLDLAKQAFKLNSKTYNDHSTGVFVQRIVEDPAEIISSLTNVVDMLFEIITGLAMIIYIFTLNLWVSIALLGILVVAIILEYNRVKIHRKDKWSVRLKRDKVHSLTTEIVRSEKDIKSLGLETKLSEVSKQGYQDFCNQRYMSDKRNYKFTFVRNFLVGIGTLFVMVLGVVLVDKALMTVAAFMIIYSNRSSLWSVVYSAGNLANTFITVKVCHKRMFALFDEDEFITEKFGTKSVNNVVGAIEFKNVSYTFKEYEIVDNNKTKPFAESERKLVSENQIFNNLSFKIQPNTTVAFVGKSGSGKSTILNLMSKMYDVDSGEVLIDDINIQDFDKNSLRSTISLVNQFPYIFDMSIKENLLLAKADATQEEIDNAIKKASLSEFVETLPRGINSQVGESGIKLSGGQKQRLAIARALLRNSAIIIFDESTSSLDNFAQEEIKQSIDALKGKSTIVIVAHRLSTIKNVDHIFFLDNGKIEDEGTFDQLFRNNPKFKSMFLAENI